MKKALLVITASLFLSLNAYSQTGLKAGDPLVGDWEIVLEEGGEEEYAEEEETGAPDFHNNSVGIGIMSFKEGNTAMFAGFRVDEGYACPIYPEFSVKGNVISAKSTGPCSPEPDEVSFKFTYKVEKDILTVTYKGRDYKYKRFKM